MQKPQATCDSLAYDTIMIVKGALCIKASCVFLVEASRVPGEGRRGRAADETRLQAGLLKRHSVRAAKKVQQLTDAAVSISKQEPPAAPCLGHLALRLLQCRQLYVTRSTGRDHPLPLQRIADTESRDGTVGAE